MRCHKYFYENDRKDISLTFEFSGDEIVRKKRDFLVLLREAITELEGEPGTVRPHRIEDARPS